MRLRKANGERRSSDHRNNDVSWISEVKDISNVAVRKKRGRRAPPSAKRLRGQQVDKVIDSDDAVDNDIDDTDEGQVGKNQSIAHIEECIDGGTGDLDIPKTGKSGNSSDGLSSASEEQDHSTNSKDIIKKSSTQTTERVSESPTRSKKDEFHLKQEGVDIEPTGQNDLANEDGSHAKAAVVKKGTVEERSSQEIKDDVFDAQVNMTSSENRSAEEIEDVKVCDICGDVGDEDKLAVCSRCNDGAEHTYCMRVMMEEVPDSEWLCEDCQTVVELEKKKLEKCEVKVGTSKGQFFEGKINEPLDAAKRSSSDSELNVENVGNKESDTANEGSDVVNNRMEEDAVITSLVRETIPEPGGLYTGADSRKRMPLSQESSFKFDADKGKQPSHQVATSLASNAPKNQAPQPRGQLSKSTSFNNSKVPKVKQLLNEVPQKPKNLKESWSSIIKKEGPVSMTTKSATFKKPKPSEPANKAKSSILSTAEGPRVVNPLVSQNVSNDRCTSILGCPSVTTSMVAPVLSKADTTAQHLATGNNMSDSNNLSTAHGQGGKNSLGNSELKKLPLAKVPGSMMICNAEKSSGILGPGAQRKIIQNSDPSHRDNKIKDPPGFRLGASGSNRAIRCQRCNEAGHSTQFCALGKLRLSAIKPLSERNLKEASAKRNKTSETSTMVATEKAASRIADQSEQIPKCGTSQNQMYGPTDVLSASFSHLKKPSLFIQTNEQDMRYGLSNPGSTASVDCIKLKSKDDNPTLSATTGSSVDNGPMPSDQRDESSQGFSTGGEPIASTVPELDYIWQGGFELWRTGRSPELCDGFQAHLSCSASQSVLEVAKKFPSKVQLEELPRQNSWPTQFQESGPTYDNVGLFFFARDVQSYENHYSKLVENMLKNDLVLRGSVDTVELLIFPSNILSKNFQRWNMLYFLWGVFRVSRKDCSNLPPDVPTCRRKSNLSEDPWAVDPNTSVLSSSHSFSKDTNNFDEPDRNFVKSATCADYQCLPSLEANHQGSLNGENSLNQPVSGTPLDDHHDSVTARCSTDNNGAIDHSATAAGRKHQNLNYSEHRDKTRDTFDGTVSERDFDVNMVPIACSVPLIHEEPGKESKTIKINDAEHLMDIDHVNTAEVNTGALDPFLHASGGACKRDFEMINGADGALEHKKIKLDNVVSPNSGLRENINDGRLSSKMHPLTASSVDGGTDNKLMAGSSNSDGKCVFPLDLNEVDDAVSENIVNILSSDDEESPEPGVPDLKLETRDDRSSGKVTLSSVSSKVGEKQNNGDNLPTDITGSLSLSLGFPSRKGTS
ncbi:ASI1-immunoprecipitated protein 2-like isoform X2 [Phragmites australis]|uniref:ASI1-immunoprecipitated protein 2-like isoform X2 n=1 Tax=Phragmites australis TaxID=29695 RepID=UPI002D77EEBD|nr:ASI1-immunoprecipitated protein 2-like isoform X2 [Phragmites australis]